MASRLGSARTGRPTVRPVHPAIPALSFVVLVTLFNGALNRLATELWPTLPLAGRFEYAVTVPLSPPGAVALALGTAVLTVWSLALFVRAVPGATGAGPGHVAFPGLLRRFARATVVGVGGAFAALLGAALLVVPGLVVALYLPYVFLAVVLDDRSIAGAIAATHGRVTARPLAAALPVFGTLFALVGLGVAGVVTSVLPPAVEFVVGATTTGVVVLLGMRRLTVCHRAVPQSSGQASGQL